jgi:acetyl esterase/lipase
MLEYATHYLQDFAADDPKASPILAPKHDWPPVYLEASKAEYLWSDSDILAKQLKEANIPHQFRIEEGALHGWQLFPDLLPEAKRSIENMTDFIRRQSVQRTE